MPRKHCARPPHQLIRNPAYLRQKIMLVDCNIALTA